MSPNKVVHIITALGAGGAERMLYNLLAADQVGGRTYEVISLTDLGVIGEQIQNLGVVVHCLGMRPGLPDPIAILRLTRLLRTIKPDLIQTWMYHADLMGGLAGRLAGVPHVVWGIHHADLSPQHNKRATLLVARLCALLSKTLPQKIVVCSHAAVQTHTRFGYNPDRMVYIPNGIDLSRFRPDPQARQALRSELKLPAHTVLIGMAARFHPLKDHYNFVRAAAALHANLPDVHFVLCGTGIDWQNNTLTTWIRAAGLEDHFHLLGIRQDMPTIFSGIDIGTLSSISEAFPFVIGEMMACELPCVVTNVGDAAKIVGACGRIVTASDSQALTAAWEGLLQLSVLERSELGKAARCRVEQEFEISRVAARYISLYNDLMIRK